MFLECDAFLTGTVTEEKRPRSEAMTDRGDKMRQILFSIVILTTLCISTSTFGASSDACKVLDDRNLFPKDPTTVVPGILKTAGDKILALRRAKDFDIKKKTGFADLKTKGDCTSQNYIFGSLKKLYPNQNFLGEEKCEKDEVKAKKHLSRALWILDPIDGTTNYAHGLNHFNISLALVIDGTICYGAVYAPAQGELFYARKGKGAFLKTNAGKTKRIRVSQINNFRESLWVTGFKAGKKQKVDANIPLMREVLLSTHGVRRPASAALDLAYVADGRIEGYWELFMDWWDVAAGLLLVEEAGGKSFIIYADETSKGNYSKPTLAVLASNGNKNIHGPMKTIVSKVKK